MTKTVWLWTCIVIGVGLLGCSGGESEQPAVEKPERGVVSIADENSDPTPEASGRRLMVLLEVCTLRKDYLGAYGEERNLTPNIDALAAEGVVYEDPISSACWTKPSTASLLTGLHPGIHGLDDGLRAGREDFRVLPEEVVTLAERLKESGYQTAAFVGNPHAGKEFGLYQGFDHHRQYRWSETGESISADALEVVDGWSKDKPMFLFLLYADSHSPYIPEADIYREFEPEAEIPEDWNAWVEKCKKDHGGVVDRFKQTKETPDQETIERIEDRYAASVKTMDRFVGRFLEGLRARDLYEDSTIVVVGDHGESFWEDGQRQGHGRGYYPEVCQVPLIVRSPAVAPGRVKQVVSTVGVAPLLAHISKDFEAKKSKLPDLLEAAQEDSPGHGAAYSYVDETVYQIRKNRAVRLYGDTDRRVLYDRKPDGELIAIKEDDRPLLTRAMYSETEGRMESDKKARVAIESIDVEDISEETQGDLRNMGYL